MVHKTLGPPDQLKATKDNFSPDLSQMCGVFCLLFSEQVQNQFSRHFKSPIGQMVWTRRYLSAQGHKAQSRARLLQGSTVRTLENCCDVPHLGWDLSTHLLQPALALFESLQRVILQGIVLQHSPDILHAIQCNSWGHSRQESARLKARSRQAHKNKGQILGDQCYLEHFSTI